MAARALPLVSLALASSALGFGALALRPRVQALEHQQEEAYFASTAQLAHHAATADVRFASLQVQLDKLLAHQKPPASSSALILASAADPAPAPAPAPASASAVVEVVEVIKVVAPDAEAGYPEEIIVAERELELLKAAVAAEKTKAS